MLELASLPSNKKGVPPSQPGLKFVYIFYLFIFIFHVFNLLHTNSVVVLLMRKVRGRTVTGSHKQISSLQANVISAFKVNANQTTQAV